MAALRHAALVCAALLPLLNGVAVSAEEPETVVIHKKVRHSALLLQHKARHSRVNAELQQHSHRSSLKRASSHASERVQHRNGIFQSMPLRPWGGEVRQHMEVSEVAQQSAPERPHPPLQLIQRTDDIHSVVRAKSSDSNRTYLVARRHTGKADPADSSSSASSSSSSTASSSSASSSSSSSSSASSSSSSSTASSGGSGSAASGGSAGTVDSFAQETLEGIQKAHTNAEKVLNNANEERDMLETQLLANGESLNLIKRLVETVKGMKEQVNALEVHEMKCKAQLTELKKNQLERSADSVAANTVSTDP